MLRLRLRLRGVVVEGLYKFTTLLLLLLLLQFLAIFHYSIDDNCSQKYSQQLFAHKQPAAWLCSFFFFLVPFTQKAVITKWSSACQGYIGKERNTVGRQRAASGREGGGGGFGGGGGGGGGYDEKASLIEAEQRRKMEQMDQQVMSNDSLIQEREDAIKDIESQMLEVNDIFKDLSVAVQDQGHQLDSIEANMSQAYSSVDDGAQQLEKANRYQKKSRNKMCCFLLILIIVLAIVVVPLVLNNNKPAGNKTLTWQNNF